MSATPDDRFWAKVDQAGDCWLWLGHTMSNGYGQVRRNGVLMLAHRYAYELTNGPIPEGMDVAHACPNRGCVRPDHLVAAWPNSGPLRTALTATERFWPKVDKTTTCWLWAGGITAAGYGALRSDDGSVLLTHRFSYELHVGPIPDGLVIDHLCRNKRCCNPTHLEAVTQGENVVRAQLVRQSSAGVPA